MPKRSRTLLVEQSTRWWVLQLWAAEGGLQVDSASEWCSDIKIISGKTMDEAMQNGLKGLPPADDFARDSSEVNYIDFFEYFYTVCEVNKDFIIEMFHDSAYHLMPHQLTRIDADNFITYLRSMFK